MTIIRGPLASCWGTTCEKLSQRNGSSAGDAHKSPQICGGTHSVHVRGQCSPGLRNDSKAERTRCFTASTTIVSHALPLFPATCSEVLGGPKEIANAKRMRRFQGFGRNVLHCHKTFVAKHGAWQDTCACKAAQAAMTCPNAQTKSAPCGQIFGTIACAKPSAAILHPQVWPKHCQNAHRR